MIPASVLDRGTRALIEELRREHPGVAWVVRDLDPASPEYLAELEEWDRLRALRDDDPDAHGPTPRRSGRAAA